MPVSLRPDVDDPRPTGANRTRPANRHQDRRVAGLGRVTTPGSLRRAMPRHGRCAAAAPGPRHRRRATWSRRRSARGGDRRHRRGAARARQHFRSEIITGVAAGRSSSTTRPDPVELFEPARAGPRSRRAPEVPPPDTAWRPGRRCARHGVAAGVVVRRCSATRRDPGAAAAPGMTRAEPTLDDE